MPAKLTAEDRLNPPGSISAASSRGAASRPRWSASGGKGSARGSESPNSHGRVVEIDLAARRVVNELQVWNPDYAFAYPVLAVNARDEVGIMLGFGGTNHHANCAMGILGDFVVWYRDDSSRTVERFGDYLTTRLAEPCTYPPFYAC